MKYPGIKFPHKRRKRPTKVEQLRCVIQLIEENQDLRHQLEMYKTTCERLCSELSQAHIKNLQIAGGRFLPAHPVTPDVTEPR